MGTLKAAHRRFASKSWGRLVIVVIATLAVGVGLWLNSPPQCSGFGCGLLPPEMTLAVVSFGSNGWVIFNITNDLSTNLVIVSVTVYQGLNSTALSLVSPSSNNIVPARATLYLPVHFQGIAWQSGVAYEFILRVSSGHAYGVTQCLAGC